MGFAIARAAVEAGAQVQLISGPVHLDTPLAFLGNIQRTNVTSAQEMHDAVLTHHDSDVFFSVAAVADWRVSSMADQKIKKQSTTDIPYFASLLISIKKQT